MGSVILKFIMGGIAGLIAWMIFEPFYGKAGASETAMVCAAGTLIGATVGGLSGFQRGGKRHTFMGLGFGALFGAVGILLGYGIAGTIQSTMFPPNVFNRPDIAVMTRMMARILGLTAIGTVLGLAVGGSTLNLKRTIQGGIGGLLAGLVSGVVFDPIATIFGPFLLTVSGQTSGDVGTISRALTFLLLGSLVALFIGIVERIARSAWLRLTLGRNEGKEWSIDSGQTFIGRSEGAQIPLFGDNNVAPIHASIVKQGGQYILIDGGSPIGTLLNGQRIQQAPLMPGSQIQIGSFNLTFLVKNAPAPARGPEPYPGQAFPMGGPQQPQPGQMYPQPGMPAQGMPQQMPVGMPTQVMPQQMPQQQMQSGMPTQVIPSASPQTMAYGAPLQAAPRGMTLVAIDGPLMGQRFPVQGPIDLGRDCPAIPMSFDSAASRRHANVSPAPNGLAVMDAGSTNGTFVNGQRVSQAMAGPGDLVKIGSTTFRVEA